MERYKDDEASAHRRINKAKMDMEIAPLFRNTISNANTEEAVKQIKEVILKELAKNNE